MSGEEEQSHSGGHRREDDWDSHIARKLRQALEERGVSYEWLAAQVTRRSDRQLTARKLKEKLSKGDISAPLLLQIIDSLDDKRLSLKDFYDMESVKRGEKE